MDGPVSRCEPAGPLLRVPRVAPGDVGLVVEVHGLAHDAGEDHWWLLDSANRSYRLPVELHQWADRTRAEVHRRFLAFPKVFAFSIVDDDYRVQLLSMA
ncbi:hypothetical protein [Streptomyces werraensis]|uniref:hypothetical protein n=1 Tax=Streptomyces werraensis TaxID=68284 RepID=UPI00342C35E5